MPHNTPYPPSPSEQVLRGPPPTPATSAPTPVEQGAAMPAGPGTAPEAATLPAPPSTQMPSAYPTRRQSAQSRPLNPEAPSFVPAHLPYSAFHVHLEQIRNLEFKMDPFMPVPIPAEAAPALPSAPLFDGGYSARQLRLARFRQLLEELGQQSAGEHPLVRARLEQLWRDFGQLETTLMGIARAYHPFVPTYHPHQHQHQHYQQQQQPQQQHHHLGAGAGGASPVSDGPVPSFTESSSSGPTETGSAVPSSCVSSGGAGSEADGLEGSVDGN